jgi:AcrR family transcriptional regulator
MKSSSYQNWISEGYTVFAYKGPAAIIIENIAAKLGVSKSSFYHHFGEQPYFIEMLLEEHLERAQVMGREAALLTSFIPGFLQLLLQHKTDVLFNKQLRIHRENKTYQTCFQQAAGTVNSNIQDIWKVFIGVEKDNETADKLFLVIEDMFYQRVTTENFTVDFMEALSYELKALVENLSAAAIRR